MRTLPDRADALRIQLRDRLPGWWRLAWVRMRWRERREGLR
jgi:hypothetical protein